MWQNRLTPNSFAQIQHKMLPIPPMHEELESIELFAYGLHEYKLYSPFGQKELLAASKSEILCGEALQDQSRATGCEVVKR